MNKKIFLCMLFFLVFSSNAYSNDKEAKGSLNGLQKTGAVLTAVGLIGVLARGSSGSTSSGFHEAKQASGLIVAAGVGLIVIGHQQKTKLAFSYEQSAPALSLVHHF